MGFEAPFYMGATTSEYVKKIKAEAAENKRGENIGSRFRTFWRETLILFYGAILLTCLVTAAIICH